MIERKPRVDLKLIPATPYIHSKFISSRLGLRTYDLLGRNGTFYIFKIITLNPHSQLYRRIPEFPVKNYSNGNSRFVRTTYGI